MPISITQLYDAVASLDDHARSFRQVSYNLAPHNTLPKTWWVFMPYGTWLQPLQPPHPLQPLQPQPPSPSPLESAILCAIEQASTTRCSIDILHLYDLGGQAFFADKQANPTIAKSLANFLNDFLKNPSNTATIRYLVGSYSSKPEPSQDGFMRALFDALPQTGLGKFLGKLDVFYGNFAPNISKSINNQVTAKTADIIGEHLTSNIFREHLAHAARQIGMDHVSIENNIAKYANDIVQISKREDWVKSFVTTVLPAASWNHAKIFAINGRQLVTGGANYWNVWYTTGATWLFDLSATLAGDAAIDAHQFANYLWKYLENIPSTDGNSCSRKNLGGINDWSDRTPATQFTGFAPSTEGRPVLTVGRNGNWASPAFRNFPMQVVDAVRDFLINVAAVAAEKSVRDKHMPCDFFTPCIVKALDDGNPLFRAALKKAKINPAAWASRYARNYAISQAQSSIRFSQQKFVMDDLRDNQQYKALIARINAKLGTDWDGYIWPYDTLCALGHCLATISQGPQNDGVEIVSSTPNRDKAYEDPVSGQEFKDKLIRIMTGMKFLGDIHPKGEISDLVNKRVTYRRVDPNASNTHGNHSKLVVVDDAVCYVGSDNAYPSYNEEFGVWIDDATAISSLVSQYWDALWNFSQPG